MHWILPLWAAVHNDVLLHSHLIIERLLDPQIVVPRTGRSNLYHQHGDAAFVSQVERRLAKPVRDFIQHNDIRPKRSDSRYPQSTRQSPRTTTVDCAANHAVSAL